MNSANVEKLEVAEKSTSLLLPTHNDNRPTKKAEDDRADNMFKIQHFFLTLLLVTLLTLSLVSAASNNARQPAALAVSEEQTKFQDLLNSVEPGCLHEVLHQFMGSKYKHGVYQEDKTAMEVLHQSNAEVAHSLIELAKRQGGTSSSNGSATTTTAPDSTSTTSTPVTSTTPPTTLPTSSSTTVPVPPTTSTAQTTPQSTSSATTGTGKTTPPPSGSTTPFTTTPSSTPGSTSSTRSSSSESSLTTSRSVTQQVVYTTTGTNGAQETVTRTTIVPADQAETGTGGTGTNTATASLQSNGVNSDKSIGLNLALGALGLIMAGAL